MKKCESCPVPEESRCRGELLRHKCNDARYRAYFARIAAEDRTPKVPSIARYHGILQLLACAHRCKVGCHSRCNLLGRGVHHEVDCRPCPHWRPGRAAIEGPGSPSKVLPAGPGP